MSKADTLGPAPTFSAVRSARRNAIDRIGGKDATAAITELAVTLISENPDNPRNHLRNLDETTESVREVGIILPIVVATTEAYLRDRPDRANDLDDGAQYVVVDGHRRLEASRRVGLATIPVRVDNARVATDESLLEAAFVANYHRDDMTDLEEAHALKQLVDYYGSQTKAAKRLGIPQGTISSKLSLLKLTPDLQKDLVTGARKVEHVRNLGKLSPEEQRAKANERAEAASRKAEVASGPATERPSGPADYHGVIITESELDPQPAPSTARSQPAPDDAAIPEPRNGPAPASAPQPTPAAPASDREPEAKPTRTFPYDDPYMSAQLCWTKMDRETYLAHIRNEMRMLREERPEDFRELASELDV
ncbi:ParB/RepB/Spo0J family partition protein (plasmid) [Streptomyces hirsutus]|uniref:ParB/RepB/Spo0J family partition protein n=1 Tax=Streptomyces hirsutus TaxID=35620 RepID=UPI002F918827|nr:ParB/RepB/Spo0J family partition protein [Streptomyces hirsutus]